MKVYNTLVEVFLCGICKSELETNKDGKPLVCAVCGTQKNSED